MFIWQEFLEVRQLMNFDAFQHRAFSDTSVRSVLTLLRVHYVHIQGEYDTHISHHQVINIVQGVEVEVEAWPAMSTENQGDIMFQHPSTSITL